MHALMKQKLERMPRVLELCGKGMDTSRAISKEIGVPQDTVQKYLAELEKAGKVFRATITVRETYWYTTQQEAAKCVERHKKSAPSVHIAVKTATKFEAGAQIVIPKGVKVQQCPQFKGLGFRDMEPEERAFSQLGPGRYLESDEAMLRRIARKGA